MTNRKTKGALLARGQETSAHCSPCFRKSKLYKMRLVNTQPTIFGDYSNSDQWELFVKAMKDDLYKRKTFKFRHPNDSEKEYERHYIGCPANGIALLTVGQFKKDMDFAFVWIVLKSALYGEPYLVLGKYSQSFHNPDILAKIVESAFNWVLKGKGVKLVLEPWETDEKIMWAVDYNQSYMNEMTHIDPSDLILVGYEDALEDYMMKLAKRGKQKINKEKGFKDYILFQDKNLVMRLVRQQIKNTSSPKRIAMPFRLLNDRKIVNRIPYKIVVSEYPELEGNISETRYNYWTNAIISSYEGDLDYIELNKEIDSLLMS